MGTMRFNQGDVIDYLKGRQWLVENGFLPRYHAVISDPPYALISISKRYGKPDAAPAKFGKDGAFNRVSRGFMGQTWDGFDSLEHYQDWVSEWGRLMLSFVYPGAVGMFFGGTRTYHRLACGLENAGWEIQDVILYLYGSGFPKSHDISKAIDRAAGVEREVVGSHTKSGDIKGGRLHAGSNEVGVTVEINHTRPATEEAARWEGYGTALKPMVEPVIIARAPRQGYTYAQLAQEFGSGALNIDGGRIGDNGGRFPGNVALMHLEDCTGYKCAPGCPVQMLDGQSGERPVSGTAKANKTHYAGNAIWGFAQNGHQSTLPNDTGGASRFFYTAKAGAWERVAGLEARSTHPTLKPINLIEWLATLSLPPPGDEPRRILVPFGGVGSEMIGAHLAGWDEIDGIEQSPVYIAEGEARAAWWSQFSSYAQAKQFFAPDPEPTESDLLPGDYEIPGWGLQKSMFTLGEGE